MHGDGTSERELYDDAVDVLAAVQFVNFYQYQLFINCFWQENFFKIDADVRSCLFFQAHIDMRRRVITNQ